MIIVVICVCSLILSSIIWSIKINQKFTQTPKLSLQIELNNNILYILYDAYNYSNTVSSLFNTEFNVMMRPYTNETIEDHERFNSLKITDVFTYSQKRNENVKLFSILPDTKHAFFMTTDNLTKLNLKEYLNKEKPVIQYIQRSDLSLLNIILKAMDINLEQTNLKLEKISSPQNGPCIFIFSSLHPAFTTKVFSRETKFFNFVDYLDMNKLWSYIPFVRSKNIDMSKYTGRKGLDIINTQLILDLALYGRQELENNDDITNSMNALNVSLGTFDKINYYAQNGFHFFRQTLNYIKMENDNIKNTRFIKRSVLEQ